MRGRICWFGSTLSRALRRIHRWISLYRQFGLAGLARKPREDRGKRRAMPAQLLEITEALALENPPIPIAAIHRRICQVAQKIGGTIPSYDVVYEVVRQLPTGLVTLAHQGKKAYSAAFELIHRREAERPMRFGRPTTPCSIS
jgi:putative transposase